MNQLTVYSITQKFNEIPQSPSPILQAATYRFTTQQHHHGRFQRGLMRGDKRPTDETTRIWIRIPGPIRHCKKIQMPRGQGSNSEHNSKRVSILPTTNRGSHPEITLLGHALERKPQVGKGKTQCILNVKINEKMVSTLMGTASHN